MKKLYIALSFVAFSISISAQNNSTKTADKLFSRFEYVDAAKEYLKLVEKGKVSDYVYKQLADTYYNLFNPKEAVKWYEKATKKTTQDAETYYRFAEMLKANGKYEDANKQMQKFASMAPNDMRAKTFLENPDYIPALLSKAKKYNVNPLAFNNEKSEFAAVLYNDILYFASARNSARRSYGWTDEPYLDIYKANYNSDGTVTNPTPLTELNSRWHDGPITISADGKTAYFASESFKEKASIKDKNANADMGQVYLYKAVNNNDKWSDITPLPFNDKNFSNRNPSLSRDGKTLYFSSNRPGGIGGEDIWKVSINADGTYGTPENLGAKVNTEGNESFPFISDDNKTLFFASTGKQGLGGLDVYQIDLSDGSEAINLGKPVNTEKDDFGFTFNTSKKVGFLSSNRNGNDDIFQAIPVCDVDVLIVVTDAATGKILPNARVAFLDDKKGDKKSYKKGDKKSEVGIEMSNDQGEVRRFVDCNKAYVVSVSKEGYSTGTFAIAKGDKPSVKVDAPLKPFKVKITLDEVVLDPIYFEFNKSNITEQGALELDKLVQVMNEYPEMIILAKSHTDSRGDDAYNLVLSESRAQATVQYVISKGIDASRISGKGMGELEPKIPCGDKCTEEEFAQNRRSEFLIVKK